MNKLICSIVLITTLQLNCWGEDEVVFDAPFFEDKMVYQLRECVNSGCLDNIDHKCKSELLNYIFGIDLGNEVLNYIINLKYIIDFGGVHNNINNSIAFPKEKYNLIITEEEIILRKK